LKRITKCVCFCLIAALLVAMPVCATENVMPKASNYFMRTSVYTEQTTGRTFQVWFDVTAVGVMDELGAKSVRIERSTDNANWETVTTFSKDVNRGMICENTGTHISYVSYTGSAGYYYRAYVTLYAKDGNSTAELYKYTTPIYYPSN